MNSHLLPFPYNQSQPPTRLDRIFQPILNAFLGGSHKRVPQKPSTVRAEIALLGDGSPIRIICISDTHNLTPPLPPGDILIHAGDLTPHTHKIVIAGNHDIILDETLDGKLFSHQQNGNFGDRSDSSEQRGSLDWGHIHYLKNEAVTLQLLVPGLGAQQVRQVKIFGSPLTPEFGSWAFQYPAIRDVWTEHIPDDTQIVVVHCPPALYGDCDGEVGHDGKIKVKGDGYLLREIRRVRPKFGVCGHIHGAFGTSLIEHHGTQEARDRLRLQWSAYSILNVLNRSLWKKFTGKGVQETLVVNAAVAPGNSETQAKSPVVIGFNV
ncbi:uncharacterized protein N7483_006373 [Penicillium malachiteum]|uniref:uncharacterized protein n=1 Tax=Penicillium malachiteum TaxID=1324776 RepID=UPI002547FACD|nr:uncharacterized protein N7483_006373 [Penicillium malachiteum]KAJ5725016.1 hypothetical protein N7483_006373 [Penicillium malachiteum]